MQIVKVLSNFLLRGKRFLELHLGELVDQIRLGLLDVTHGELLVLDDADTVLVELNNRLHHAKSLVHGAVEVVLRERVLLQEFILDYLSSLYTA